MKIVRLQQILIELLTETDEVWIRATLQRCTKEANYVTSQTVDRVGFVHRAVTDVVAQTVTVYDPVAKKNITISGAGILKALRKMILAWVVADRGGTINANDDVTEP